MPKTRIILFKEDNGSVPVDDWLGELPDKMRDKMLVRIQMLQLSGHELRRPHVDFLRDGIHELRAKAGRVNLRILYFFHGRQAVVLSHGITKQEACVPDREIVQALSRKTRFESNPEKHTFTEDSR